MRNRRQVIDRRWKSETKTNANGDYAVCGVPLDAALNVFAATDSSASGLIELPVTGLRIQRRDLIIAATRGARASMRGVVAGLADGSGGRPVRRCARDRRHAGSAQ